jgi:hypothetical protein
VVVRSEHLKVTLADDQPFYEWAHEQWPGAQYTILLDPWGPSRTLPWSRDRTAGGARVGHRHLLPYRRQEVNLILSPNRRK